MIGLLNPINHQAYLDELEAKGVPVFSVGHSRNYLNQVERILLMTRRLGIRTLVFWNLDARVKLMLAKVLSKSRFHLIDVSPGPWTFEDLNAKAELQQRLALDKAGYFDRLDHFVSKYKGGDPPGIKLAPRKLSIIPNGVPNLLAAQTKDIGAKLIPKTSQEYIINLLPDFTQQAH